MTVAELIAELQKYPPDAKVTALEDEGNVLTLTPDSINLGGEDTVHIEPYYDWLY